MDIARKKAELLGKRQRWLGKKGRIDPQKSNLKQGLQPKNAIKKKTRRKTLRPVDNARSEPARGTPAGSPTAYGGGSPLRLSEIRPRAGSSERLRLAAAALAASPSRGAAPAGHPRVRHVAGVQGMRACGPFSCTPTGSVWGFRGRQGQAAARWPTASLDPLSTPTRSTGFCGPGRAGEGDCWGRAAGRSVATAGSRAGGLAKPTRKCALRPPAGSQGRQQRKADSPGKGPWNARLGTADSGAACSMVV